MSDEAVKASRDRTPRPTVAVVIPVYNRADLIGETLRAILEQTRRADDVIVVDDGSTDDTREVIEAFGAAVRCLTVENGGDMVARNIGLRATSARLVAFCDSDDVWEPEFLEETTRRWDDEPGMLACYADFRESRDGRRSETTKLDGAPPGFRDRLRRVDDGFAVLDRTYVEDLLRFQPFFPSCIVVAREPFMALGGWDESVSRIVGCDLATAIRVASNPPVGVVTRPLATIRKHSGNISGDTERMNLGDAEVLERILAARPELARFAVAIGVSVADRRQAAMAAAFDRRDFDAVRRIYGMVPRSEMPAKGHLKRAVAALPGGMANRVSSLLSRG